MTLRAPGHVLSHMSQQFNALNETTFKMNKRSTFLSRHMNKNTGSLPDTQHPYFAKTNYHLSNKELHCGQIFSLLSSVFDGGVFR